ncbi:hypothetical protein ACQPZJ_06610 [Actinoplanes sp. CA-054009]
MTAPAGKPHADPASTPSTSEIAALHGLLLRTAGRLPGELTAAARRWLADGDTASVAQAVTFAALTGRVTVTPADAELLAATGADADAVAGLTVSTAEEQLWFALAPVGPETLATHGDTVPYSLDLTTPYDGPGAPDPIDEALRAAAPDLPVVAAWRAWRFPARNTPWPPPRRVYLVQTTVSGDAIAAIAPALQDALTAAGETDPQVEVFTDPGALPAFQRTALSFGALLYATTPPTPIQLAQVFDKSAPPPKDDKEQILDYLQSGTPLLISPELTEDVAAPVLGAVVPVGFHTDGHWVWPEATAYYLTKHNLAPDPALLAHIRSANYQAPEVDAVAVHRALTRLYTR